MEGTYDLDGDGFQEFATVEKGFLNNNSVSLIRYYEINNDGYQQMNWELKAPDGLLGNFVDVELGDLNGDGIPELITVSNLAEPNQNELLQPIAFYYSWDGEKFNETAGGVLNLSGGLNFVRAHNFSLIDYDGDMDQEIAVSLGSPLREIVILDINQNGDWKAVQTLKLNGMRSGIGAIYVSSIDSDRDGYDEIIAISPEGEILRTQPFYNLGGELVMGSNQETPIPGLDGLISTGIKSSDWDKDGFEDLLLPFFNGDIISLSLFEDFLSVEKLPIDGGPLSSLQISDFNQDTHDDLLLVSGDMNILSLTYGSSDGFSEASEYFTLEDESITGAQVFSALPISSLGVYTGKVIAAGWDGSETTIIITELGFGPEPDKPLVADFEEQQEDVLDVFPFIAKDEILLPKIPKPLETMGQPLPDGILPKHVLTVNQSFAYTLPEEEKKEFYSFRWLQPPPKGMFFHYDSRSIRWVPDEMQLGAYKLSYHVERKLGEEVVPTSSEEDSLITYKVIPSLEGDDAVSYTHLTLPTILRV